MINGNSGCRQYSDISGGAALCAFHNGDSSTMTLPWRQHDKHCHVFNYTSLIHLTAIVCHVVHIFITGNYCADPVRDGQPERVLKAINIIQRLDIGPIWKQLCDNLVIIWSNLPIRQRINYFICHNNLLEYAESDEWLIVCCGVYTVLALAATTNQRRQLRSAEVLILISARGISIYNGPLPMITAHC